MTNTKWPIVITTIFPPNTVIRAYAKLGHPLIVVGDKKTAEPWSSKNCHYISVADQKRRFPDLADVLPWNHYGRKNLGYLHAMKNTSALIETDDDNLPLSNYPNFKVSDTSSTRIASKSGVCNIYQLFLKNKKTSLWPRGFPLERILEVEKLNRKKVTTSHYIQQGLINGDTDVDAIYRLTNNTEVTFKKSGPISLAPHTYAPINTQNTFWHKEAFLLLYLPVFATFRSCDIYKGWIAQRLLWEIDSTVLFLPPSVIQKRNPHNYLKDFESEVPLFLHTSKFLEVLERLKLRGSLSAKLLQTYTALIKAGFMDERELAIVKMWVSAVEKAI
jgi:hypothetical protein